MEKYFQKTIDKGEKMVYNKPVITEIGKFLENVFEFWRMKIWQRLKKRRQR